jgi:putative acetyltransferase
MPLYSEKTYAMIIRRFHPPDLEPVLELFHEVVHSVGTKYYTPEQLNAWAPALELLDRAQWLASLTDHITYVAEDKGHIVAFGDMTQTGMIDRLYAHKNYQGQGISRTLFKQFEEDAQKLGITELTIDGNIIIKTLAQRHGFEVVQIHHKIRRGAEFTNYIMRKQL